MEKTIMLRKIGSRTRGRPKRRWIDLIKRAIDMNH